MVIEGVWGIKPFQWLLETFEVTSIGIPSSRLFQFTLVFISVLEEPVVIKSYV